MNLPKFLKNKNDGNRANAGRVAQSLAHRVARDPYLDWAIIFVAAIVIAVVFTIVGICVYSNVDTHLSLGDVQVRPSVSSDTKALSKVLGQFKERSAERAQLLQGYTGSGDPSL